MALFIVKDGYRYEPGLEQYSQMLGHRRLCEAQCRDDIVHRTFAGREEFQDVASTGFGDRI